jgi:uncharacterized protein (TIGR02996 family)
MTDRAALLRAIVASPGDDTPKLVYADLLDETGGPPDSLHASLIRQQYPPSLDPKTPEGTRWSDHAGRVLKHTIKSSHTSLYPAPDDPNYPQHIPTTGSAPGSPTSWHRQMEAALVVPTYTGQTIACFKHGFVVCIATSERRFIQTAAALFREQPIERVCINRFPNLASDVYRRNHPMKDVLCLWERCPNRRGDRAPWVIRPELFDLLTGEASCDFEPSSPIEGPIRSYPSIDQALGDLGNACLLYGRGALLRK